MSQITELPIEIKRLIVSELNATDLKELVLVSKEFHSIAIPILYSTIRLRPHPRHGIDPNQKRHLFNNEAPNPNLRWVRNFHVIHPEAGRGLASSTIDFINTQIQPRLKDNQLHSLALSSGLEAGPEVLPFLLHNRNLRALRLNVPPPHSVSMQYFDYLGLHHYNLQALSLQMLNLNVSDREADFGALNKLLCRLKNLHSLDIKFWERDHRIAFEPPCWPDAIKLLDTIFGMKSLRQLSLLGNDIPIGYWAEANSEKRVGKGLTLFRSEVVDRGESDRSVYDRDNLFWFTQLDVSTLKSLHLCLGILFTNDSSTDKLSRFVSRATNFQNLLADCEHLEELWCCSLPQIPEFDPSNHCLFRAKDTLKRLRICCSDWWGMGMDGFLTKEQNEERERNIISELTALRILEVPVNWPVRWRIKSDTIELVHILREPRFNPADFDSDEEDEDEDDDLDIFLKSPTRILFLQKKAQEFARVTQPKFLPSLKIVVFNKINYFREHSYKRRFEGVQGDREEYPPLAYSVEREGDSDLPYGVAEPLSFKDMEEQYPWLYDGRWAGRFWDESRGYRFW
ncbi:hypothetical protein TWF718_007606 [Orbilia javanica]|uniref:F-box domain-containing protein n=1 Tax=Orbilia javanica TaxID=47235 RepID=A0AAN8NWF2_9PEZI